MKFLNKNKFFNYYLPLILLVIVLIVSVGVYLNYKKPAKEAEAAWYSSSWSFRKQFTIDHTKVSTASSTILSNFPVLFSKTDTDLRTVANGGGVGSVTGLDILFTSGDGVTKLDHQIETYASTTGAIVAWFRVPKLSNGDDESFYIYYGNAGASDQSNATGVWDGSYKAVYHLPDGTTLSATDSTSNGFNGSAVGSPTAIAGQIDGAGNFSGSSQYYTTSNMGIGGTTARTIEVWAKRNDAAIRSIISWGAATNDAFSTLYSNVNVAGDVYFGFLNDDFYTSGSQISTTNLTHIVVVYDGGTVSASTAHIYVNGIPQSITKVGGFSNPNTSDTSYRIASDSNTAGREWNGILDELRVSNTNRSPDWISTEYNNQSSPSTFFKTYSSQLTNSSSSASWYNAAWGYRKSITINHNKISQVATTTYSSFPFLFNTTDSDLKYTSSGGKVASSTGGDILFTASDGTTKLDFEIERYSSTTGETIAWVRIPLLLATSDTTIYIYFGNASATNQQNKTGVWDGSYKGVWHLPNGTTLTANDSTINGNNGTLVNGPTAGTGQIDGAGNFVNASTQYINFGTDPSLNPTALTYSAWIKATSFPNGYNAVISKTGGGYSQILVNSSGKIAMYVLGSGNISYDGTGSNTLSAGTFYYITLTYDSTSGLKGYINASLDGSDTANGTLTTNSGDTLIARDATTPPREWDGIIDEARVSNIARSADWITTEYNNQSSPSGFYAYGSLGAQTRTGAGIAFNNRGSTTVNWYSSGGTWSYRKPITIDHTKISQVATTTYSSFPFLFNTTDSDLKYTSSGGKVASSTGGDILFTASDGTTKLDFEIEKYASTTGETVAWVRIPLLLAASDTTLYIYFGNASATSQQNATGVWDTFFTAVYHLSNNGTALSYNDSTSHALNLTNNGAGAAIAGKVDGAADFSGGGNTPSHASDALYNTTDYTLETWLYSASATVGTDGILAHGDAGVPGHYGLFLIADDVSTNHFRLDAPFVSANLLSSTVSNWTGVIHDVVVTKSGTNYAIYIDGVLNNTNTDATSATLSGIFTIANYGTGGVSWPNWLDEVRISSTNRSADWVSTEYNNQNSPSTFYAYAALGTQTRSGGAPALKARGGVKFR